MRRAVLALLIVAAATARVSRSGGVGPNLLPPVSDTAPAAWGDCITRSYQALRSCVESHGSATTCYNNYISSSGACGWKVGAPGQPPFGFPTTYVGGHQQYLPQYQNPYGDTATIYASFTPWHNGHNGYFSPADLGPFTISYFQRRELRGGEKQKLLVSFDPTSAGPYQARLFVWLDHRGTITYLDAKEFQVTAVDPPPPPPPPCLDICWSRYAQCERQAYALNCPADYRRCSGGCNVAFGDRTDFLPGSYDFRAVPIGSAVQDVIRLTNPNGLSSIFEDGHATLYASWAPFQTNDIGHLSPPDIGPFHIVPQQRTEFKKKETREFAVQFRPTSGGSFAARLYVWWDYKGAAHYDRTIDYAGYGYLPAAAAPGGSTSGRNGAAESYPEFLFDRHPPPLWKMSDSTNVRRRTSQPPPGPAAPEIGISELLPATVSGFAPQFHEPEAVILGGNNATESIAADYIDPSNGSVQAVALVLRTRRDPYAHTYGVCSRVKGAWMDDVRFAAASVPASQAPATFWESSMSTHDEAGGEARRELATGFIAYLSRDNRQASIDSQWLVEHYTPHPDGDGGEILTFQLWSPDAARTAALRASILDALSRRATVTYRNRSAPSEPAVYINGAAYDYGTATLWTTNRSGAERTVDLTAITWSAANPESQTAATFTRTVPAGDGELAIPLPGQLNGVIYLNDRGSPWSDMVYVADGVWFSFGDSGSPAWSAPECPAAHFGANDLPLAGCARLATSIPVNGYRGIGRSLASYTRDGLPLDAKGSISFFAKGEELTGEVKLAVKSDDGQLLRYKTLFTPSGSGRQITIPLASFIGFDEAAGRHFSGGRVVEITWNYAGSPHDATDLLIGNVYDTNDLVVDAAPTPPSIADVQGPYPVSARLPTAANGMTATLAYRRRGESEFVRAPMTIDSESDLAIGSIPGQPSGTLVEWYVELADDSGRRVTAPGDAPFDTYFFSIAAKPELLIADFADPRIRNRAGSANFTFASDDASARTAPRDGGLQFRYDVSAQGSFAGWVAPFAEPVDASVYSALRLRVRGSSGAEPLKIGLGDADGHEQKILLARFGAITRDWTDFTIPLANFTAVNPAALRDVLLVAENASGAGIGSIDVDDIRFTGGDASLSVPVDNFDDALPETAFGGNAWAVSGGSASAVIAQSGGVWSIHASGRASEWATAGLDLRDFDARGYTRLRFRLRGAHGGERPHVYLASGPALIESRRFVEITATNGWQEIAIPLQQFAAQGTDLSDLTRIELVWEWRDFDESVEIDDVIFE